MRVARGKEDVRYAVIRRDWGRNFQRKMFGLMIVQAPVSAVLAIAILFAAHQPEQRFRPSDIAGLLILIGAVAGEAIADGQMTRFKADLANHGKVCDRGLWAWSRHPNYFFETLIWVAFPVMGISLARPWSLLSLGAPIVMFLLIRYVSGVPPLEAAMLESKGDAYRRYQQRVAVMLPWRPNHESAWATLPDMMLHPAASPPGRRYGSRAHSAVLHSRPKTTQPCVVMPTGSNVIVIE